MEPMTWDYILKYVIVGDAAVGKSALLLRLTDDRFALTEPTLGVEFGSRILSIGEEGKRVKVQCWDTAGTESFRSITRSYFRGAAGALLVYDVTRRETFEHVNSWLHDLQEHADENVCIILVANKTDLISRAPPTHISALPSSATSPPVEYPSSLPSSRLLSGDNASPHGNLNAQTSECNVEGAMPRQVTEKEGREFANRNGLLYVETSAKEGWNVVNAFEWTAREVLTRINKSEMERKKKRGGPIKLDDRDRSRGCC
ncbi:rab family protein [Tremella mesenterica]|uniref:Rab family protein n=1 Tax=Tremella mesenterica TaxID=5217 RepID=A0A4Q1BD84_TREME|nr:rab family protein [Tremella mesenterica]